jgi:hypothetical protein
MLRGGATPVTARARYGARQGLLHEVMSISAKAAPNSWGGLAYLLPRTGFTSVLAVVVQSGESLLPALAG